MFGYDTGLGGGLIALPAFKNDFGFNNLDPQTLADTKGNVVSILQGGWYVVCCWISRSWVNDLVHMCLLL
jgi:hypothetical protein